jgi:hypothetical protein
MGGIENPMRERQAGTEGIQPQGGIGWLKWAGRHPGLVLLGSLAVAILACCNSPEPADTELDASGEEVPLFI